MSVQVNTVEEALQDIRDGKAVIVFDDIARENEGDFIASAELITPEVVNFMVKYGRGLICTALTEERCKQLSLGPMVDSNTTPLKTNFTVSVDLIGHGCSTGVSAFDRAQTIKALVDKTTVSGDLARPGHMFPLIADPQGVLGRRGHTEASVDLARLAGLDPSGVLVEVMNEDGTMARWDDLVAAAHNYSMKLITISGIVQYRIVNGL